MGLICRNFDIPHVEIGLGLQVCLLVIEVEVGTGENCKVLIPKLDGLTLLHQIATFA